VEVYQDVSHVVLGLIAFSIGTDMMQLSPSNRLRGSANMGGTPGREVQEA